MIKEELLHYLWRTKNFNHDNLATTDGTQIKILKYGYLNPSDGPDFLEAKVEIGDVQWNGAIEIHVKSSDWNRHGHQNDNNYKKTILHVVMDNDKPVKFPSEETIPCLVLKDRISKSVIDRYATLENAEWIPCQNLLPKANEISIFSAKEKSLTNRLSRRLEEVALMNDDRTNNWEEVAYRLLLRSFGLVHNANAFLEIAKRVPLNVIKKNADSIFKIEALLFGVSGMLERELKDNYPKRLKTEFEFLSKKYGIGNEGTIPIKFKAVRPQNFPTIKLSQFANLICQDRIIDRLLHSSLKETEKLLRASASDYWTNHYTFDKITPTIEKRLGISRIRVVIINAIVPILYFLGKRNDDEESLKKAYSLLEDLPSEKNSILTKWKGINIFSLNAFDSQALLELKKNMCDQKACLSCPIGHSIMKTA